MTSASRTTRVVTDCHTKAAGSPPDSVVKVVDGVLIPREAVSDLVEALDTLAVLAADRGARLPARIERIRAAMGEIGTRANTRDSRRRVTAALESAHAELGLVDITTAAKRLGIKEDSVRDLVRRGKLPAMRINGRWWVDEQAITARIERRGRS